MKKDHTLDDYIAGWKTPADWRTLRPRLLAGEAAAWKEAFAEYFKARLELRYLHPITLLQENGTLSGEGFSILAIQCTLIEFLESTAPGTNYRYVSRGASSVLTSTHQVRTCSRRSFAIVSRSQRLSIKFPCRTFTLAFVVDCYTKLEPRTVGASGHGVTMDASVADVKARIVFRDDFQRGLVAYVESYGEELQKKPALQAGFIRKFDDLCA